MTMRWTVGTKIGAGFGLALAILVAIGGVSYRNTAKLTETAELVDSHPPGAGRPRGDAFRHEGRRDRAARLHHHRRREISGAVSRRTGDESSGHQDAQGPDQGQRPTNSDRLDILEPLINGKEGKFAELQETIDARRDKARGFAAALQIVVTDKGKKVMDDIRKTVDEMRSEENTLLKTRSDEAQMSARNTTLTIVVGTLAAVIVLAVAGFVITRNIARPLAGSHDRGGTDHRRRSERERVGE